MIEAYPLHWPINKPRTPKEKRKDANFHSFQEKKSSYSEATYKVRKELTIAEASKRLLKELNKYTRPGQTYRVHPDSIIISTNIPVKKNGLPYSNYRNPDDPGVAVYFELDEKPYCLPCDKWNRIEDNIAAIASHISAMRGIERWGVGEAHDVFTGFKALPETTDTYLDVWKTLGLTGKPEHLQTVKNAYKYMASKLHPDKPTGSHESFTHLQEVYQKALMLYNQ